MYQRILVAIDASESANKALGHALLLAKDQHADLSVVHVIEDRESRWLDVTILDVQKVESKWREAGQAILDAAARRARQVGVASMLVLLPKGGESDTAQVIVAEAERWRADLIVLGTHGQRSLSRLFMRSVAQRVAGIAPVPVLLVR
jgi:nucleotide-binding universal stress UspA family protein